MIEFIRGKTSTNLVFTSAGRNGNVESWLGGHGFDLFVTDYVSGDSGYKALSNYYIEKSGGKFQNLYFAYKCNKDLFMSYEAIMVLDDDIIISAEKINELFEIRKLNNFSVIQPAFSVRGKVSHHITKVHPFSMYRKTNFVEVTCPLFKSSELTSFLEIFDPRANGGGVDFWFCNHVESRSKDPCIAIIDNITCVNPYDEIKGGTREIDLFRSREQRNQDWATVRKENLLEFRENEFKVYSHYANYSPVAFARYVISYLSSQFFRLWRKIVTTKRKWLQ